MIRTEIDSAGVGTINVFLPGDRRLVVRLDSGNMGAFEGADKQKALAMVGQAVYQGCLEAERAMGPVPDTAKICREIRAEIREPKGAD